MKKFSFYYKEDDTMWPIRFLSCVGDEQNLCDNCKARFHCYTGSVPYTEEYFTKDCGKFQTMMNMALFGVADGFVGYDFDRHDKYYTYTRTEEDSQ